MTQLSLIIAWASLAAMIVGGLGVVASRDRSVTQDVAAIIMVSGITGLMLLLIYH